MTTMPKLHAVLFSAMLSAGAFSVQAAEAPYYNPANAASQSGMTQGYELFKTIGCPGRGILETPCKIPAAPPPPVVEPAPVPAPAPAPVVVAPVEVDSDKDGIVDRLDSCPNTPLGRAVNALGCEIDSDGDGVIDALDTCPNTPAGRQVNAQGCEPDGDGDKVPDALDNCPTTPAGRTVNALGCEIDTDGDGVVDALDKCPTTPAGRKVNAEGCELDGDGDGVVDGADQCPTTPAGHKVNDKGCDLDSDADSVIDLDDKCPATPAGDRVNSQGCSLPNVMVLNGVTFANDKDVLLPSSTTTLEEAVATLKRYPGLKVEVAGHTDNVGRDAYNLDLSQRRANAVMAYFVSHGIAADRLSAKGYGETQPVADNAKVAGRAQNRRVELRAAN